MWSLALIFIVTWQMHDPIDCAVVNKEPSPEGTRELLQRSKRDIQDIELISLEEWQADQKENREASSAKPKKKWILIQYRFGKEEGPFEANGWEGYKKGFGSVKRTGNGTYYWIGLEKLHELTSTGSWDVYFILNKDQHGAAGFICHDFTVASELVYYRLGLNSCGSLIAKDKWWNDAGLLKNWGSGLNNAYFSTKDRDYDPAGGNCAVSYRGGFWYYNKGGCIHYYPPTGNWWNESKMAIRPA